VQDGPAWSCAKSMTRMPSSAWLMLILLIMRRCSCLRNPRFTQCFAQTLGKFSGRRQILVHPRKREAGPQAQQCLTSLSCPSQIALHRERCGQEEMSREMSGVLLDKSARPSDAFRITLGTEVDNR